MLFGDLRRGHTVHPTVCRRHGRLPRRGLLSGARLPVAGLVALLSCWPRLASPQSRPSSPLPALAPVRLCAGGDVAFGTDLMPGGRAPVPPRTLVEPLRPMFADADLVLLNVETAIGAGPASRKCPPGARRCYAFRAPVEAATALRAVGGPSATVVGTVANNHARDAGAAGWIQTQRHLQTAGVQVTGADTLATPVHRPGHLPVAVLGFHTSAATPDARDLAAVRRHVARAVAQHATVVVTVHHGAEGPHAVHTRPGRERFAGEDRGDPMAFVRTVFDAGATAVIGHGPHVVRALQWDGERLALYSLGNLLTAGPFSLAEPLNRGVVACMTLAGPGRVTALQLTSTHQRRPGGVELDREDRARLLMDRLTRQDFPPSTGATSRPPGP